jgi:hypothetical protein
MEKYHENIQLFLNKYKLNTDNKNLSFPFKTNPDIYIVESQLPDLYIKTRQKIDKNVFFVFDKEIKKSINLYPR